MKYLIILSLCFAISLAEAQIHFNCKAIRKLSGSQLNEFKPILLKPRGDWPCAVKTIPVNFVFLQKDDGSFNFTETTDGLGNPTFTGYDFAHTTIDKLNDELKKNDKMNIPPGNNTPILEKNYRYIAHGVYFVKRSVYNKYNFGIDVDTILKLTSIVPDSQFTVFIQADIDETLGGGYAWTTDPNSKEKYTANNGWGGYYRYRIINGFNVSASADKITYDEVGTLRHELLHLLTLDHTVKYPDGCNCPCKKMPIIYHPDTNKVTGVITPHNCASVSNTGVVDASCKDLCDDTPLAWYMVDTLNSPIHPGDNSAKHPQFYTWFSNNQMEYTGYNALSRCQIDQINNALEGPMSSYLLCNKLTADRNYCGFNNYITAYYGRNISVNKNCGTSVPLVINSNRYVKMIADGNVEVFGDFEVKNNAYFEVINDCGCVF